MKIRLVADWKQAWKWLSVNAMALAIVVQGAWQVIDADMRASLPSGAVQLLTIALLVLGIVGRLVDQSKTPPQ